MTIALLTQPRSLRDLLNEQASGRGVLRLVTDATLAADRALAKAGIRLFCPDDTDASALADLRRAAPKARAYTRATYLEQRQRFISSLGIRGPAVQAELLDLLLVVLCEIAESGHPVYLIVDDEKIPAMLSLGALLNDLFDLLCERLKETHEETAAVMLVPASACAQSPRPEAAA